MALDLPYEDIYSNNNMYDGACDIPILDIRAFIYGNARPNPDGSPNPDPDYTDKLQILTCRSNRFGWYPLSSYFEELTFEAVPTGLITNWMGDPNNAEHMKILNKTSWGVADGRSINGLDHSDELSDVIGGNNLPDFRGTTGAGGNMSSDSLTDSALHINENGGSLDTTITIDNLPKHIHSYYDIYNMTNNNANKCDHGDHCGGSIGRMARDRRILDTEESGEETPDPICNLQPALTVTTIIKL